MTTFADIMDKFEATDLLREVKEVPAYYPTETGLRVNPKSKTILFADNDDYVSTVGSGYQIIQNEEVYSKIAEGLIASDLNLDGMTVDARGTNDAFHMALIQLPNHAIFKGTNNETHMQICPNNGHTGMHKLKIPMGGIRTACANGQISGSIIPAYASSHTSGYSVERLAEHFMKSLDGFDRLGHLWVKMQKTRVNDFQADEAIALYLNKKVANAEDFEYQLDRSRRMQSLRRLWNAYKREMGSNMYALYNALTDDASHSSDKATMIVQRQNKIEPVVAQLMAA